MLIVFKEKTEAYRSVKTSGLGFKEKTEAYTSVETSMKHTPILQCVQIFNETRAIKDGVFLFKHAISDVFPFHVIQKKFPFTEPFFLKSLKMRIWS